VSVLVMLMCFADVRVGVGVITTIVGYVVYAGVYVGDDIVVDSRWRVVIVDVDVIVVYVSV